MNTKIHTVVDGLENTLKFMLTAGDVHDSVVAVKLLSDIEISKSNLLADKAYGTKEILDYIQCADSEYKIPPKSNTITPWKYDWHIYKERHVIECFFKN